MSSPFHTLKKNKVPLFPAHMTGNRPIPFRHPEYSEDECRLLEEITTGMVHERKKRDPFLGLPHLSSSPRKSLLRKPDTSSSPSISPDGKEDTKHPPSDRDLMRLMMNKISILEKQNQTQENELRTRDRQIKVLEDKLRIAEKARKENINTTDIKDLETHCLLLQQQVHEMETFLAEYGMVWVGESVNEYSDVYLEDDANNVDRDVENNNLTATSIRSDSADGSIASSNPFSTWGQDVSLPVAPLSLSTWGQNVSLPVAPLPLSTWGQNVSLPVAPLPLSTWGQDVSLPVAPLPLNIDFNQLIDNVKDLNILAGEGITQIKKTADGARFEVPEPVQLTIYANGILMFGGPFRPYTDPATRHCIQDLMDGYFPSELQNRYPDGVPFALTDLRETHFQPKRSPMVFSGEGQTLGGEIQSSRLVSTYLRDVAKMIQLPTNSMDMQTSPGDQNTGRLVTTENPGQTLNHNQFLNQLPKVVIKDGKVIDIRDSISKTLAGNDSGTNNTTKSNVTLVNTRVTKEMAESVNSSERPRSYKGHGDVTTLRIMTENGDHTFIVKMKFKETVGDLRSYLDSHRRPTAPYDIVSTFPYKIHTNNMLTLEVSGLTPNAVLHLKPHK